MDDLVLDAITRAAENLNTTLNAIVGAKVDGLEYSKNLADACAYANDIAQLCAFEMHDQWERLQSAGA